MNRKRLVNGRDMRDFRDFSGLRGDPMRPSGVGMHELNAILPDKRRHAPGIHDAKREGFEANRHGHIGLIAMETVGDPKYLVFVAPSVR
jgi:hypothetical protein